MAWKISNQGFELTLSAYVSDLIQGGILNFFSESLKNQFFDLNSIQHYAIHPGGIKILKACETALNLEPIQNIYSYEVLRQFGNMSSATIIFVLKALWLNLNQKHHLDNIFSCAFGPGLTVESLFLKFYFEHKELSDDNKNVCSLG